MATSTSPMPGTSVVTPSLQDFIDLTAQLSETALAIDYEFAALLSKAAEGMRAILWERRRIRLERLSEERTAERRRKELLTTRSASFVRRHRRPGGKTHA